MFEKLNAAVEALRADAVETLAAWIRIPSEKLPPEPGAPFGKPAREALDRALADAERLGLKTRNFDGYIGDAEMGEGEETMGILAHLDVVPAGDGWQIDPFGALIEDGKMYGRGASDDKGPAVAALFAMKAVLDAGYKPTKRVRLILGCDEESGWADIRHYQEHAQMPDFGFSPDAAYPVINTEKGILHLRLTAKCDCASVRKIAAGERPNVIPGLAVAEIACADFEALQAKVAAIAEETGFDLSLEPMEEGFAKLISEGVPGHASMPQHGKNAAGRLLVALNRLGACGSVAKLAETIGDTCDGKGLGVDGFDAISGALTLNLGILKCEDGLLSATIDIRHPVLMSGAMIARIINLRLADAGFSLEVLEAKAPLHVPADTKIVRSLLEVYHEATGKDAYAFAIGGGTYSRSMDNCVAFGCTFPGGEDLAHQAGEYINLDEFVLNIGIFARAIVALAC